MSGANPAGKINYGSVRLMFSDSSRWAEIETAPGVYDEGVLASLDKIITSNRENGASVIFGMNGTPLFYAQTAPNPIVGDDVTKDPIGLLGGASYPNSLTAVTEFVQMVISRYNKPGGVWYDIHGATLGKGIQYWETGNEPPWDTNGNRATAPGQTISSINFWGTNSQMIDFMATQYDAIKSIDTSVVVLAPGLSNHAAENNYRDLEACFKTLGTTSGKYGYETFDAFAWHPYYVGPPGVKYGTWFYPWIGDMAVGPLGAAQVVNWIRSHGFDHPAHATEWGLDTYHMAPTVLAWQAESAEFRYNWIARTFMCAAATGVASIHPWNWQVTGANVIAGDYQNDIDGAQRAYNDCAARLSGKTIIGGSYSMGLNGRVKLTFSDGTLWVV